MKQFLGVMAKPAKPIGEMTDEERSALAAELVAFFRARLIEVRDRCATD